MSLKRGALAIALTVCLIGAGASIFLILDDGEPTEVDVIATMVDPLLQDEGHDHRNASQHIFYTENIQPVSF
ncbi:MAG: hypothetical protein VYD89_04870, partial [Candidatus Thermoplasmatota archaeon]|nr:hypothetical protein [Candidatus Thermoplasmatota archaeon]